MRWEASAYFVLGFLTCAVMSGAVIFWAVMGFLKERQDDERDAQP